MSEEEENSVSGLSKDPKLSEMFDFFDDGSAGMRIVPVSFKNSPETARQLIAVMGTPGMVHQVMAKFMSDVEELHMMMEQEDAKGKDSVIESVDGKKMNGGGKIVVP